MPRVQVSSEVDQALKEGRPVVALESTVISHGLPFPTNLEVARDMETIIRHEDCIPATIAILHGVLRVGLEASDLEFLAESQEVAKASSRDIPFLIAGKGHGATTVAATLTAAHYAGIHVFATGGLGGVHKNVLDSMDISADVLEVSRRKVALVCSGMKSILDIGRTLEMLETLSVPVGAYQTWEFPAFYAQNSGYKAPRMFSSTQDIAAVMEQAWELGWQGGILIANPIPKEEALPYEETADTIEQALQEAYRRDVQGPEMTPFLLSYLHEQTEGTTLQANAALLRSNAFLASQIARAYAFRP